MDRSFDPAVEYLELIVNMSDGTVAEQIIKSINLELLEDSINLRLISASVAGYARPPCFIINEPGKNNSEDLKLGHYIAGVATPLKVWLA